MDNRLPKFVSLSLILLLMVGCGEYVPLVETSQPGEQVNPDELEHVITSHPNPSALLNEIQPGDLLNIRVTGANWDGNYLVPPSGKIDLPPTGPVNVVDLTPEQVKKKIHRKFLPTQTGSRGSGPRETVQPGDKLEIKVVGEDWGGTYIVPSSGELTLPFIGSIQVVDRSLELIRSNLLETLQPEYFKNPYLVVNFESRNKQKNFRVSVNVKSFGDITVRVLGAVDHPRRVEIPRNTGVIDALLESGDITKNTILNRIFVFRERNGETYARMVNYNRYARGDLTQNVILQEGDVVYAPFRFWPRLNTLDQLLSTLGMGGDVSTDIRFLARPYR